MELAARPTRATQQAVPKEILFSLDDEAHCFPPAWSSLRVRVHATDGVLGRTLCLSTACEAAASESTPFDATARSDDVPGGGVLESGVKRNFFVILTPGLSLLLQREEGPELAGLPYIESAKVENADDADAFDADRRSLTTSAGDESRGSLKLLTDNLSRSLRLVTDDDALAACAALRPGVVSDLAQRASRSYVLTMCVIQP
eukprot:TRINITY_DN23477_c0_g1_i1.p2 TRINITY_DN23477_c0_g1~~TRINITY_DN23477_c0_g1_i1.p2  ORF type:complete len:202 (-),score=18.78 TRINITY_DN23477_c0_g1_i1:126-731(-)